MLPLEGQEKGVQYVKRLPSEPEERFVNFSERIILECKTCKERLVLLGREDDWYSEGRTAFPCGGCGRRLTLADRIEEADPQADPHIEDLLRSLRSTYYDR